ncbi:MAG: hypothetical protein NTZ16_03250, partial [Verrucomicrobia bacterium]|nr:hypothetical protein [Verrucomicrobiota bacterium]
SHWAAGITAATAGIFRGLLYFQIIPPGTAAETIVKSIVLLAIAVLPVLVLYPAARISGYYLGWVYKENKRRLLEYRQIETSWKQEFQEALKSYIAARVTTANTLQRKMAVSQPQPVQSPIPASNYVRQAFEALCAEGSGIDPLNIRPSDVQEHLEAGGITGIKEGTLRPTIQRVKASYINDLLTELDSSPYQPVEEFCERLSS